MIELIILGLHSALFLALTDTWTKDDRMVQSKIENYKLTGELK